MGKIMITARLLASTVVATLLLTTTSGCSIKRMAVNKVGDALAGGGTTFTGDEDPELVRAALPFSLKLMESLLAESPRHRGLLEASASGFMGYSYLFVQQDADEMEEKDFTASVQLRNRGRQLCLRARDYGLRGLDVNHPGFAKSLRLHPRETLRAATVRDVPLLYWTTVSWAAAIGQAKNNPALIAELPVIDALVEQVLQLDEKYDSGAMHSFLITYEMTRPGPPETLITRSREHFDRALQLCDAQQAGPYLSLAEAVSLPGQNRAEFESLLKKALAINPAARPEWRLVNVVMQRRARWLLDHIDDLFPPTPASESPKPENS